MLPVHHNTDYVIFRAGRGPPDTPDVSSARGHLCACHAQARRGVGAFTSFDSDRWTHLLLVGNTVDVRDGYDASSYGEADTVYIPDADGTAFAVKFVEVCFLGHCSEHKRVYLDRKAPTWPSDDL